MRSIRILGVSLVALAAVATVAVVSVAAPAAAAAATPEEKAKAREHYQKGLTHYDLKEYGDALGEFKNAYRLVQDPAFLFNIAQCHRRLGQNVEALDFYRNYLRRFPNASARVEVERRVQEIERELVAHPPPAATSPPPATTGPGSPNPNTTTSPPSSREPGVPGPSAAATVPRALPPPTEPPPVGANGASNVLITSPPPPDAQAQPDDGSRPLYKRWWFWTLVGAAVAGGVAVGVAVATRGEIGDCRDLPASSCRTVMLP